MVDTRMRIQENMQAISAGAGTGRASDQGGPRQRPSNWYLMGESRGALKHPARCLKMGTNKVGKGKEMDVRLPSRKTSTFHCILNVTANEVILRDRSRNGTYVNHSKYHNSRQILSDGDLIAFGQITFKYDVDDHSVLVYRLRNHEPAEESITLSDDDGEPLNSYPVKSEIKSENEVSNGSYGRDATELRDNEYDAEVDNYDGENGYVEVPDDAYDWNRAEMFVEQAEAEGEEEAEVIVSESTTATPSKPNYVPNLVRTDDTPVTTKIKEEISWNMHEYERSLHPTAAEPEVDDGVVDLCSEDDDETFPPSEPIAPTAERRQKRHKPDDYELKWKQIDAKCVKWVAVDKQPPPAKKPANELPESEKHRLIESIQLNPKFLKANAHVVTQSRANRLALDMLGIGENASTAPTEKPKPSFHNMKVEPIKLTPEQDDGRYTCKWSAHIHSNRLITEITRWNVQWLLEQNVDAPVCGDGYHPSPVPDDFDSLETYQRVWGRLSKSVLWDKLLRSHRSENANRAVFPKLKDVKYVMRHDEFARFIFFCEVTINENDKRSRLLPDHLVLVVHGGGKFLAMITDMKHTKVDGKSQMTFQMEAAKERSNEKLSLRRPTLLSVKSIKNIRIELEQPEALMAAARSPLIETILHPSKFRYSFVDSVRRIEEMTHLGIAKAMANKCIGAVLTRQTGVYILEGGAGTGKSTILQTALKFILKSDVLKTQRILFCGASIVSVNQTAHRFIGNEYINGIAPVRFGKPETINAHLASILMPAHNLTVEQRQAINNSRLVLTTADLASELLKVSSKKIDLCIMDEATMIPEQLLLPLLQLNFNVLVMAGDKQLQYTDQSNEGMKFYRSLFTRIIDSVSKNAIPTLRKQFRMHPQISNWPNKRFYEQQMLLTQVSLKLDENFPLQPYTVFNYYEDQCEVTVAQEILSVCMPHADQSKYTYGIIPASELTKTQLDAKVRERKEFPQIDISNCDCFQGTERDIILITAIKADFFGLLSSSHMINVALTRARRTLIVCGNFYKVKDLPVWKSFLDDAKDRGRFFTIDPANSGYVGKLLK